MLIENIVAPAEIDGGEGLLAFIIRSSEVPPGLNFHGTPDMPLQVATIRHPKDHVIPSHVHLNRPRTITTTPEVLVVQDGYLEVVFYTSSGVPVTDKKLGPGDVLVLLGGGHGFKCITDVRLVEVKQGPFYPGYDKVRF